jgi:hypothetical protein
VKSLPGEELLRGGFDLEPVLHDGTVQKLGHTLIRTLYQGERSLSIKTSARSWWGILRRSPWACQEDYFLAVFSRPDRPGRLLAEHPPRNLRGGRRQSAWH